MVIAAFPLAKIGLLLLKQISKPLATFIKNEAKKHPKIRKQIIIPTGKAYNWVEMKTIGTIKGKTSEDYEKLTEEEFVQLGANAIGEILLFGFLTIILMAEISRQGDKRAVKAKKKEEEILNLVNTVTDIIKDIEKLKKAIKSIKNELRKNVNAIDVEEESHELVTDINFFDNLTDKNHSQKDYDLEEIRGSST